ncbi:unnamed protein product [Soboliphyme baturini]|uniref:MSP domain-containing protein n=1 Tax=Soboliphyme baturini TaxID=241478 RepID=A0A183J280_9BILA|nr:unnamed protein product [Soboliphyme baturini]
MDCHTVFIVLFVTIQYGCTVGEHITPVPVLEANREIDISTQLCRGYDRIVVSPPVPNKPFDFFYAIPASNNSHLAFIDVSVSTGSKKTKLEVVKSSDNLIK